MDFWLLLDFSRFYRAPLICRLWHSEGLGSSQPLGRFLSKPGGNFCPLMLRGLGVVLLLDLFLTLLYLKII